MMELHSVCDNRPCRFFSKKYHFLKLLFIIFDIFLTEKNPHIQLVLPRDQFLVFAFCSYVKYSFVIVFDIAH